MMTREIRYKKIFRALELYGKQSLFQQFGCNSKNNGISLTNKIYVWNIYLMCGLHVFKRKCRQICHTHGSVMGKLHHLFGVEIRTNLGLDEQRSKPR